MTTKREPSDDLRQAVADAEGLLKDPKPDRDRLSSTLQTLLKTHEGWVPALEYAALLAPLARNRKAWDYVRDGRGPRMRAFLGYLAYRRFLHDGPTEDEKEQWFHLVEDSARRGHMEARLLIAARKAPQCKILRTPFLALYRLYLILSYARVAARNRHDDRLPHATRTAASLPADERYGNHPPMA